MNDILSKMQTKVSPSFFKEKGATMIEYAIMVALIAVVSIGIITTLGRTVSTTFNTVNSSMATTTSG
jgi:pilus assembly protein Flp/PilA